MEALRSRGEGRGNAAYPGADDQDVGAAGLGRRALAPAGLLAGPAVRPSLIDTGDHARALRGGGSLEHRDEHLGRLPAHLAARQAVAGPVAGVARGVHRIAEHDDAHVRGEVEAVRVQHVGEVLDINERFDEECGRTVLDRAHHGVEVDGPGVLDDSGLHPQPLGTRLGGILALDARWHAHAGREVRDIAVTEFGETLDDPFWVAPA